MLITLIACSVRFGKPEISLPPEPTYEKVQIHLCTPQEKQETALKVYGYGEQFRRLQEYCIDRENMAALLRNLIKDKYYQKQLIELLSHIAKIKKEENGR